MGPSNQFAVEEEASEAMRAIPQATEDLECEPWTMAGDGDEGSVVVVVVMAAWELIWGGIEG